MLIPIRIFFAALLLIALPECLAQTAESSSNVEKLIDALVLIDAQTPGVDSAAVFDGFLADGSGGKFSMGVLGATIPGVPEAMRELVRRGAISLPALLAHVDDARPTKLEVGNPSHRQPGEELVVGSNYFMFTEFGGEYDPKLGKRRQAEERSFDGPYRVKVGDVCYVLIGQIVNRRLLSVRYQPSAGLIVNSPIETPKLAVKVRREWSGTNEVLLRNSLLTDIRSDNDRRSDPALIRLRFYYPETYRTLTGKSARRRDALERAENASFASGR